jgi:TonB family protein
MYMPRLKHIFAVSLLVSIPLQTLGAAETVQNKESRSTAAVPQNVSKPNVELLTDTDEIDFKPYIQSVYSVVSHRWMVSMPTSVLLGEQGRNVIKFRILQDGSVPADSLKVEISSEKKDLDQVSLRAIQKTAPFKHLPDKFSKPFIELRFTFLYNCKPAKS